MLWKISDSRKTIHKISSNWKERGILYKTSYSVDCFWDRMEGNRIYHSTDHIHMSLSICVWFATIRHKYSMIVGHIPSSMCPTVKNKKNYQDSESEVLIAILFVLDCQKRLTLRGQIFFTDGAKQSFFSLLFFMTLFFSIGEKKWKL